MNAVWSPLWASLSVAAAGVLIALLPAAWTGWLLARAEFRGRSALAAVAALPFALPPLILGTYFLFVLAGHPESFTPAAAAVAAAFAAFPAVAGAARGAFESIDIEYAKAARSLGAPDWRIFWVLEAPLARRQVFLSAALAFPRLAAEYAVTRLVAAPASDRAALLAGPLLPAILVIVLVAVYLSIKFGPRRGGK